MQIGLFLIDANSLFQKQQEAAGRSVAKAAGVSLEVSFASGDSRKQREQIFEFVRRTPTPQAVLVEPVEDGGLRYVAREVLQKGCAWVMINRPAESVEALRGAHTAACFAVTADNVGIGRIQGEQWRALLPSGGTVLCVTGPSVVRLVELRTSGMEESRGSNISVVKVVGAWTEQSGFDAVKAWLATTRGFVSFHLIGAQNDDMAVGARRAVAAAADALGKPELKDIVATGVDGSPEYGMRLVDDRTLAATVIMPPMAGKAIELLVPALRGGPMPPLVTTLPALSHPHVSLLRARR